MEVVEHVVGQLVQPGVMRHAHSLLVGLANSEMIECDSERLEADGSQLPQVHRIFAEDARINSLVEVDPTLGGNTHARALDRGARLEPKVAYLSHNLFEPRRGNHIVVHEDQVLLRTVALLHPAYDIAQRVRVALHSLELRYTAEVTLPDATARCVGEVGVPDGVLVVDLIEDRVVGNEVLDGLPIHVIGVEFVHKVVELERFRWWL